MPESTPLKIGIDLHNLSVVETESVRTGIQQVVFNLLEAQHWARSENSLQGEVEWVPLSMLPLNCPRFVYRDLKPTHINNSAVVLDDVAKELGVSSTELWGYDPKSMLDEKGESEFYRKVAELDWLVITGLCEYRHVLHFLKYINPTLKVAVLVHDLIPVQTPRLTAEGMPNWFFRSFIGSIRQGTDLVFTVSRNTGIDCAAYFQERLGPHVPVVSTRIPAEIPVFTSQSQEGRQDFLESYQLKQGAYWICLGTIEPRKNIGAVINGFVKLRKTFSGFDNHKLVICGKKGWRGESQQLLETLGDLQSDVIFTNYISREDMERLIAHSNALVMPSRYEGFGLPLSLADKLGTPAISCANSSLPEAAGRNTVYVDPDNPSQMAIALRNFSGKADALFDESQKDVIKQEWRRLLLSWTQTLLDHSEHVETKNFGRASFQPVTKNQQGLRKKIVIDVHNLSIHRDRWVKTGIQEVSFQIIKALSGQRQYFESEGVDIILLPLLPTVNFYPRHSTTCLCFPSVFEEIEKSLDLESEEIWGFDFRSRGYELNHQDYLQLVDSASWFLVTSQFDVRRCFEWFKSCSAELRVSHIIHDVIPALFPSKVDAYLAEWFTFDFMQSVEQFSDLVVTVSRHSGLDLQKQLSIPRPDLELRSIPLPANQKIDLDQVEIDNYIKRLGVDRFIMVIGSTDPRKNVANLIKAFEEFHSIFPGVAEGCALLVVGPKVWRTKDIKSAQKQSGFRLIETGYVSDNLLHGLVAVSKGVCMPSRYEGFGLPIALAKSYGVPVLTCTNSSLPEVSDLEAIFVEPDDRSMMVLGFLQMLQSEKRDGHSSGNEDWNEYVKKLVALHV